MHKNTAQPYEPFSPIFSSVLLEGRGVGRVYGQGELAARVLHPSHITIHAGEVVVVVGPSGSGKTTLLSILGLLLAPSEGEVWLGDDRVSGLRPDDLARVRLHTMGFVFQQFNLMQGLSALENVEIPLVLQKIGPAEREKRSLVALEEVGLARQAYHQPRQLSGGQQQRVAIARAIVTQPSLILCDEPTASLDGASGKLVLDLLGKLATEAKRAVVVVSHDERVVRIADRVIEVEDGHVRERTPVLKGAM